MARNCFNILCHYGLQAQLRAQPVHGPLLFKRHSFLPLHTSLLRCAVNQTQHSFKSTHRTDNSETEGVDNSSNAERIYTKELLLEEGFVPIYRLHGAHMFAAINKVKWQQLYLTVGGVPISVIGFSMGIVSEHVSAAILCIGGMISSVLWVLGIFITNTVGIILVSPDGKRVCISYIDNKGRRQNSVFPADDVARIDELPVTKVTRDWWTFIRRYSSSDGVDECYRLFLQMCSVTDETRFKEIFGSPV